MQKLKNFGFLTGKHHVLAPQMNHIKTERDNLSLQKCMVLELLQHFSCGTVQPLMLTQLRVCPVSRIGTWSIFRASASRHCQVLECKKALE